MQIVQQDPQDL